jgi:4-hydroxybenzoate polyprenyltransferase
MMPQEMPTSRFLTRRTCFPPSPEYRTATTRGIIPLGVGVYSESTGPWTPEILFLAGYLTAMLTIAAVVFDIKDIEGDRAEGIRTVPNTYGVRATRWVTAAATALVGLVVLGVVLGGFLPRRYLLLESFTLYVLLYCPLATTGRDPLFYGLVVDGEHLFLAIVLLSGRWLGAL